MFTLNQRVRNVQNGSIGIVEQVSELDRTCVVYWDEGFRGVKVWERLENAPDNGEGWF